jgi:hypothetical protein
MKDKKKVYNGMERKRQFLFVPDLQIMIPEAQDITSPTADHRVAESVPISQ